MDSKTKIVTTAIGALFAATVSVTSCTSSSDTKASAVAKGECHGINSCKGKGDCGGEGHACAGKNACKGKGWLSMAEKECLAQKGTFKPK